MGFADISHIAFPWDLLDPFKAFASEHQGGLVDLSVGTPVDPTPAVIQEALTQAADAHGYPLTYGTAALRESVSAWFARRKGVPNLNARDVLPTIGSKELVGLLPALLGLGAGDVVVFPRVAYPTYDVGARVAGATPLPADDVSDWRGNANVKLVWVNSPGNPHGRVASVEYLREVVEAAREIGALVVSDECYSELPWVEPYLSEGVPSALDPRVCGDSYDGVLVTYSLSKQSNMAGYRAAFLAGDGAAVQRLLALRKHLGMIVPAPVQHAMVAALNDDAHVAEQYQRYGARRAHLLSAVSGIGCELAGSEAGLYLWLENSASLENAAPCENSASREYTGGLEGLSARSRELVVAAQQVMPGECWNLVAFFAERGILVAPGAFYGEAARRNVRVALTATDERIAAAVSRLGSNSH